MIRNKKGFTLGEVLVCIMIIGIIMALAVNSIRIVRSSYTSLTYFAFNNIQSMIGVLYSGGTVGTKVTRDNNTKQIIKVDEVFTDSLMDKDGNRLPSMVAQCRRPDGMVIQVLKSDREYENNIGIPNCSDRVNSNKEARNLFCNSMVSIANTSGKTDCDNLSTPEYDIEPYISDLDYNNPNFITTNGQRFYISKWTFNENVSTTYGYRLVAIDLNGKSGPNKSDAESSVQPQDIVTFLVLDNGEVFPLGVAADNKIVGERRIQYLNSKVKGYYYSDDPQRTESIPQECTLKTKDGSMRVCNYAVVYLHNDKYTEEGSDKKVSFFSYREAYCNAIGDKYNAYENYCTGINPSEFCPPSTNDKTFDLCLPYNVKPLFRFNFR